MRKKFYWKVVREVVGGYRSAVVTDSDLVLEYRIGETTKPSFGRILVFSTRKAATAFLREMVKNGCFRLLKGSATQPAVQRDLAWCSCFEPDMRDFWAGRTDRLLLCRAPEGTIGVSSFTPLEVVW